MPPGDGGAPLRRAGREEDLDGELGADPDARFEDAAAFEDGALFLAASARPRGVAGDFLLELFGLELFGREALRLGAVLRDTFRVEVFVPDFLEVVPARRLRLAVLPRAGLFRLDADLPDVFDPRPPLRAELLLVLLRPPFPDIDFFLATITPPVARATPGRDHTIRSLQTRDRSRVRIVPVAGGVRVELEPWIRTRAARVRVVLLAAVLLAAALLAGSRLAAAWETGIARGRFDELPVAVLVGLSAAVGISVPAAVAGLAALAFAEETIDVTPDTIAISTTAFERTRSRTVPRAELVCWRETYRPLSPWWTWALRRLAAETRTGLVPLGRGGGPGGEARHRAGSGAGDREAAAREVRKAGRRTRSW